MEIPSDSSTSPDSSLKSTSETLTPTAGAPAGVSSGTSMVVADRRRLGQRSHGDRQPRHNDGQGRPGRAGGREAAAVVEDTPDTLNQADPAGDRRQGQGGSRLGDQAEERFGVVGRRLAAGDDP